MLDLPQDFSPLPNFPDTPSYVYIKRDTGEGSIIMLMLRSQSTLQYDRRKIGSIDQFNLYITHLSDHMMWVELLVNFALVKFVVLCKLICVSDTRDLITEDIYVHIYMYIYVDMSLPTSK